MLIYVEKNFPYKNHEYCIGFPVDRIYGKYFSLNIFKRVIFKHLIVKNVTSKTYNRTM